MNRFESTLLQALRARGDGLEGARVLVACSGGGDSTALLAVLVALSRSLQLDLVVAHADHGLRPDSPEDAAFVGRLCRHFDLDLVEADLDVREQARRRGQGLETAARELRWAWLREEAASCGAEAVATGHTLDDHTETVFLRLSRGGGTGALTPLPARQQLRWSPLVHLRREELRAYLRAKRLPWREDPTNAEGFTPRNRWRKLLEGLRAEAPDLDAHLWETHRQVEELEADRDRRVRAWRPGRWDLGEEGIWLRAGAWGELELRWVLAAALEEQGLPREAQALRELAAWLRPHLAAKAGLRTHGTWVLEPASLEPMGWRLHLRGCI